MICILWDIGLLFFITYRYTQKNTNIDSQTCIHIHTNTRNRGPTTLVLEFSKEIGRQKWPMRIMRIYIYIYTPLCVDLNSWPNSISPPGLTGWRFEGRSSPWRGWGHLGGAQGPPHSLAGLNGSRYQSCCTDITNLFTENIQDGLDVAKRRLQKLHHQRWGVGESGKSSRRSKKQYKLYVISPSFMD